MTPPLFAPREVPAAPSSQSPESSAAVLERPGPDAARGLTLESSADLRLRAFLVVLFFFVLLKNTWLAEDAFITYRVSDNFIHGLGLRWNVIERVQVYTHPLWMFSVALFHFVSRDIYFAATAPALLCSVTAVGLVLFRVTRSLSHCILACTLLIFSKAFVDYSACGLENPLSHLLLVLFFIQYMKPPSESRFCWMVGLAGLELLNRMDSVWLVLPALAHLAWVKGYAKLRHLWLWVGLLPFLGWEAFSVLYYGFPFPNSAYAKLQTGIGLLPRMGQGAGYYINSISWDPITLLAILVLVGLGLIRFRRTTGGAFAVSLGVAGYLLYTLMIGGDYMSGRFFSAPLIVSLFVLPTIPVASPFELGIASLGLLVLGLTSPRPPIATSDQYVGLGSAPQSVDDEHGYRHHDTSFLRQNREHGLRSVGGWVGDGLKAKRDHVKVTVYPNIGYYGFFAGPEVHIIDPYGIGDPLMSRIPFDGDVWSAGHFYRHIPDGYPEAAINEGEIHDPEVAHYWEKLKLVTRGPIFSRRRLLEVLRFNLGLNHAPGAR